MPLSFLLGLPNHCSSFDWLPTTPPVLARNQLVYIGLRDVEPEEKRLLCQLNITVFDMGDVNQLGIGNIMQVIKKLIGERPVHVSFDIDSLDPTEAPATGTPVRGGLTYREGVYICRALQEFNTVSMDLVEINPLLGSSENADRTIQAGLHMIYNVMGQC
ncbi:uncharacterized protein LOC135146064 [Zophobas morio]|uniref:uncharacterized protein LOC135146063 n=1 Tax=Zophobas morio TaxID=2755281 RepID=UPI003083E80B